MTETTVMAFQTESGANSRWQLVIRTARSEVPVASACLGQPAVHALQPPLVQLGVMDPDRQFRVDPADKGDGLVQLQPGRLNRYQQRADRLGRDVQRVARVVDPSGQQVSDVRAIR